MDEFESRLTDGLESQARRTPSYHSDVGAIARRGRRRRWAQRSAGAVGAVAILGGAVVAARVLSDDPGQTVATEDGGGIDVIVTQTPTPTPTPTPQPTPDPAVAGTPEPVPTPLPETVVRDVFAVTATGWGAGLVGSSGEYFATLVCCNGDVVDWDVQPVGPAAGATRVRDDFMGGLVATTANALWWQPASTLGSGMEPTLLAEAPSVAAAASSIDLWDVIVVEDTMRVLYSTTATSGDGSSGEASLWSITVERGNPAEPEQLASTTWDDPDAAAAFVWTGGGWLDDGGRMELRAATNGACEWVVFNDTDGSYESPFAAPDANGECRQDSIGAAAINANGQLAVISRYLSVPPSTAEVVVYDRQGNALSSHLLPETPEDTPRWTEIDMVGTDVLVSRGALDAPELDEVVRLDISRAQAPRPLPFIGNPAFARVDIDTDRLSPLAPDDARWFGATPTTDETVGENGATNEGGDSGGGEGQPDPDQQPDPPATPAAEPTPAPDTPPAGEIDPELRGPDPERAPLVPGMVLGDDGCLASVCVGGPPTDLLVELEPLFGPLNSALTGEDESEGQTVVGSGWQISMVLTDGIVTTISARPLSSAVGSPFGTDVAAPTVADLLRKHGAPLAVTNAVEGDSQVVWLEYRSDVATVRYGLVGSLIDDGILLEPGATDIPEAYDQLPVTAYTVSITDG